MNLSLCRLTRLPHEIFLSIISLCSVKDILRLESTNKIIRSKCQDRQLWISLLRQLGTSDAPDLPFRHDLQGLSALDLRRKVIGAIRLSHDWNSTGKLRIHRKAEIAITCHETDTYVKPRLLPGGKEVLVDTKDRLELWSLKSNKCIWVSPRYEDRECIKFDFQITDDGEAVNIVDLFGSSSNQNILRMYIYNFKKHTSTISFEQILEDTLLISVSLRSELLLSCVPMTSQVILMNWKTGETVKVDFSDRQNSQGFLTHAVELVDKHLVSFNRGAQFSALAVPLTILDGRWSRSRNPDHWETVIVKASDWPVLNVDARDPRQTLDVPLVFGIHSFKPTWMSDAPTEIYVASFDRKGHKLRSILSYRLQFSVAELETDLRADPDLGLRSQVSNASSTKSSLTLVNAFHVPVAHQPWNPDSITNAGRMCILVRNTVRCFSLFPTESSTYETQPVNWLELDEDIGTMGEDVVMTVEPWSGAIAVGTPGRVRVFYLQDS